MLPWRNEWREAITGIISPCARNGIRRNRTQCVIPVLWSTVAAPTSVGQGECGSPTGNCPVLALKLLLWEAGWGVLQMQCLREEWVEYHHVQVFIRNGQTRHKMKPVLIGPPFKTTEEEPQHRATWGRLDTSLSGCNNVTFIKKERKEIHPFFRDQPCK